jgi:hypothetical protein
MANREDIYQIGEEEGRTKNTIAEMAPAKAKDQEKSFPVACCTISFLSLTHVAQILPHSRWSATSPIDMTVKACNATEIEFV